MLPYSNYINKYPSHHPEIPTLIVQSAHQNSSPKQNLRGRKVKNERNNNRKYQEKGKRV